VASKFSFGFHSCSKRASYQRRVAASTISNYYKPVKLFCDVNDILINWKFIFFTDEKADLLFKEKVSQYSKIINVTPNRVIIKNLKNRWGSITKNKTVNLNVNLLKAPEDIIDYIIIHELCHLKIKGHSYQFWAYLKQFAPDYKQKVEWLRRNVDSLLI
jgi:predicted metal-dependent hydrolase